MLPLRLMGSSPADQETEGSEAIVAPEITVLRTVRRDSLSMCNPAECTEENQAGARKLFRVRCGVREPCSRRCDPDTAQTVTAGSPAAALHTLARLTSRLDLFYHSNFRQCVQIFNDQFQRYWAVLRRNGVANLRCVALAVCKIQHFVGIFLGAAPESFVAQQFGSCNSGCLSMVCEIVVAEHRERPFSRQLALPVWFGSRADDRIFRQCLELRRDSGNRRPGLVAAKRYGHDCVDLARPAFFAASKIVENIF